MTLTQAKSLWSYNPIPRGCVLYIPAHSPSIRGGAFKSVDPFGHICTVNNPSKISRAFSYNGSTDTISVADHTALNFGTGNFTILTRLLVTTDDVTYHNFIGKKLDWNGSNIGWHLTLDFRYAGALVLRANDGSAANDETEIPSDNLLDILQDNLWHLVGMVKTGTDVSVVVDGVLYTAGTITTMTGTLSNTEPLLIGTTRTRPAYIGDIWAFNRDLSASEISYFDRQTKAGYN